MIMDFKTSEFSHHVIYSHYHLDEENTYIQKVLYVIFWMCYAMSFEAVFLNEFLRHIFLLNLYFIDLVCSL